MVFARLEPSILQPHWRQNFMLVGTLEPHSGHSLASFGVPFGVADFATKKKNCYQIRVDFFRWLTCWLWHLTSGCCDFFFFTTKLKLNQFFFLMLCIFDGFDGFDCLYFTYVSESDLISEVGEPQLVVQLFSLYKKIFFWIF